MLATADFSVEVSGTIGCVQFKSRVVLIITAVFPGKMVSDLAFQIAQLKKKGGQTKC